MYEIPAEVKDENGQNYNDPLLQCLVIVTRLNNRPFSAEALTDGLPYDTDNELPQQLFTVHKAKSGFSRAAGRAGFSSKLVKKKLSKISQLVLPCIIVLKDNNACVLKQFDAGGKHAKIILTDFEESEIWVETSELETQYLGYAFYLKKDYRQESETNNLLKGSQKNWFWGTIWQSKGIYLDVLIASLVINLFVLASPLFVMNVYDRVVPNNAIETLWVMALGVSVIYVMDTFLKLIRSYFLEIAGKKSDVIMSSIIFEKVMNLKMAAMPNSIGSFANNLKEFESIRSFFTSTTIAAIIDLPFAIIFLLVIQYIGGIIVLAPISIMVIILLYSILIKGPLNKSIQASYEAAGVKNGVLIESLNNIETIKSLGRSGNAQFHWEEATGEIASKGLKTKNISNSIGTVTAMLVQMNTVVVIVFGVYLIKNMEMTMGGMIAGVLLSARAIGPMAKFAGLITSYEQTKTAFQTLNNIMKMPVDRPHGKEYVRRPLFKGQIEFKNVTFTYPNETMPALDDVSFYISPGEQVGLIGRIGSGKSTLAKLLLGLYVPDSGTILIDGIDINQIDPADLRKAISYVPQEVLLFKGTMKENIVYKAPHVDDSQIIRASKIGTVEDFVKLHPKGYDMPIAEQGRNLSGGQKQCAGIARAFLLDLPLILLDEPTESMDSTTEKQVIVNLSQNIKGKTVIVSTHKNSLLPLVTRLMVVNNGKLVMNGKKEDVLKQLASTTN